MYFARTVALSGGGIRIELPKFDGSSSDPTTDTFAGAELHVVGMYGPERFEKTRVVPVLVKPTDKPIVLVISSYIDARWRVDAMPGAKIKAIVLAGYFEQEVEGIPEGVPLIRRVYFGPNMTPTQSKYFWAYEKPSKQFDDLTAKLRDLTGLSIASFQGAYMGSAFTVDANRKAP
jgi:hypothetical protein